MIRRGSSFLAILQLVRAPNVFTAISDLSMGFLVTQQQLAPIPVFLSLLAASTLLYMAGMVLNDVYDLPIDQKERPARPLPSGRVSLGNAKRLGYGLLLGGIAGGWLAGLLLDETWSTNTSGWIATLLSVCVVSYDGLLKKTVLAPFCMGVCRFLNVLLGMSAGAGVTFQFTSWQWLVAAGIGIYIVGVTWFARTEARRSSRVMLACGAGLMSGGVLVLACLPLWNPDLKLQMPFWIWPVVLLAAMTPVIRRCTAALIDPGPRQVQAAIKPAVLSLIVLDAAVCGLLCSLSWGAAILALLLPTMWLGKWVYST